MSRHKKYIILSVIFICASVFCRGQNRNIDTTEFCKQQLWCKPKQAGIALGEVISINMLVWSIDYIIFNLDFAHINGYSISQNIKRGPRWDSGIFTTNFVMHPYHGSLYFNAARSCGLKFWETVPFTLLGSLMWEFALETESPSINDMMATTGGGIAVGESLYRLSNSVYDNRARGWKRAGLEIAGMLISPAQGINRLITGEMWKRSPRKWGALPTPPIDAYLGAGMRSVLSKSYPLKKMLSGTLDLHVTYNPYATDALSPYEWFTLNLTCDFPSFMFSHIDIVGILKGWNLYESKRKNINIGFFQHFDYNDSSFPDKTTGRYRFAQPLAAGAGIHMLQSFPNSKLALEGYLNGIGLGACFTNFSLRNGRNYMLGSGFGCKLRLQYAYKDKIDLRFNAENQNVYSWPNYGKYTDPPYTKAINPVSLYGDTNHYNLTYMRADCRVKLWKGLNLNISPIYIFRSSHRKYFPFETTHTWEIHGGLLYKL